MTHTPIENPMPAQPSRSLKTYAFTHNGETRTLNAAEIRRWTGMTMVRETLAVNLDWLVENIDDPKYKLLAFTTHGVMMAAHYRSLDGQRRSLAGSRKKVFNQPTGGARV
jgi:hypothetical protein